MKKQVILLFVIIKSTLSAFSNYEIHTMGIEKIEDIISSQATQINNQGEVSGTLFVGGGNIHHSLFIWSNKEKKLEEIFFNGGFPAVCINNKSQIVGSIPQVSGMFGYCWSHKAGFLELNSLTPFGINDNGIIVGINKHTKHICIMDIEKNNYSEPELSLCTKKLYDLYKITNGISYCPISINNHGEFIGDFKFLGCKKLQRGMRNGPNRLICKGFIWISKEKLVNFEENQIPAAINDLSEVILVSDFSEKGNSWLWQNGKLQNLWDNGLAKAINNFGLVVGIKDNHAVIWEKGETKKLFDLIENPEWDKLSIAHDINDQGEIVGEGVHQGKRTAFLLIPKKK